ncbi:hypothetical protein K439DRAFT_1618629 [Ramaria rubella]|nr:hypothetical protein K439DRAFT_1618629 [Ramaria rubella]
MSHCNSATAVAHLLGAKDVKYIWVTEGPMKALIDEAKLIKGGMSDIVVLKIPSFSELRKLKSVGMVTQVLIWTDRLLFFIHQSYPKSLSTWLDFMMKIDRSNLNIKGNIMVVHASPLFYAIGIFAAVWPAVSGYIRAAPSPRVLPSPMTPESFLQQIVESWAMLLFCVPSFLEAADSDSVRVIKKFKAIFWGGAPLWPEASVFLHQEGVSIQTFYGATEFGGASLISAEPYAKGYEWFEFLPSLSPELIPNSEEEDVYELVIKESKMHSLAIHNTEINGVPAYATNNLIEQHRTNPKLFKIRGRKDNQIMLSTGEKTNPGLLENIIVKNPHVKNAVMFGRGRLSNGILIEPTSYEEAENIGLENFHNLIWSNIKAANDYAPAHSRIFKETILVASALKPLSYTPKRNVRRGAIINDYALEIEARPFKIRCRWIFQSPPGQVRIEAGC